MPIVFLIIVKLNHNELLTYPNPSDKIMFGNVEADIIKQKSPECNGGYTAVAKATGEKYGRTDDLIYSELASDHPIDLTRY